MTIDCMTEEQREESFWAKVDCNGSIPKGKSSLGKCWVWLASKDKFGYGKFWWDGQQGRAQRFSYILKYGKIKSGLVVDHLCKNHSCVNPQHLEAVTQRENVLRGDGPSAQMARRTHCKNGHLLKGKNLDPYFLKHGYRFCKPCKRKKNNEWMKKHNKKGSVK